MRILFCWYIDLNHAKWHLTIIGLGEKIIFSLTNKYFVFNVFTILSVGQNAINEVFMSFCSSQKEKLALIQM